MMFSNYETDWDQINDGVVNRVFPMIEVTDEDYQNWNEMNDHMDDYSEDYDDDDLHY